MKSLVRSFSRRVQNGGAVPSLAVKAVIGYGPTNQYRLMSDSSQGSSLANVMSRPSDLFRWFDNDDFLTPSFLRGGLSFGSLLSTDLKETKDSFQICCDVPGVEKKDIHISIEDDELTISADRSSTKKEEGEYIHRLERQTGHVYRTFNLPESAEKDKISAEFVDGVLRLQITKNAKLVKKQEHRMIEVK